MERGTRWNRRFQQFSCEMRSRIRWPRRENARHHPVRECHRGRHSHRLFALDGLRAPAPSSRSRERGARSSAGRCRGLGGLHQGGVPLSSYEVFRRGRTWYTHTRARRSDVMDHAVVVRGTKNKYRLRVVPIVTEEQKALLAFSKQHAAGVGDQMFRPWKNVRRALHRACARREMPLCSPNDLRRTFGHWVRAAGVRPDLIAQMMGHADSRMVERVYAKLQEETLAVAVANALGVDPPPIDEAAQAYLKCIRSASTLMQPAGQGGLPGRSDQGEVRGTSTKGVLGPGIEPGTRGFSIRCSTS